MQALTREQRLVQSIKKWTGERLIGDDCAVLPGGSLVTADTLIQGTHFLPTIKWHDLGWKAVAVNLSDIAAMAGRPRFITVALTLPDCVRDTQVEEFYAGMLECARLHRTRIVGGDLTHGPLVVVGITALGETHERGCIRRSGALPGDVVAVTGTFGAAAAGLLALQNDRLPDFPELAAAHFRPQPRFQEAWTLVSTAGERAALMDASDGLADALLQICRESGVGMAIDAGDIPISAETRRAAAELGADALDLALYGGEDYELVAAIPADAWKTLMASSYNPFVSIGEVSPSSEVRLSSESGSTQALDAKKMYQHFQSDV